MKRAAFVLALLMAEAVCSAAYLCWPTALGGVTPIAADGPVDTPYPLTDSN